MKAMTHTTFKSGDMARPIKNGIDVVKGKPYIVVFRGINSHGRQVVTFYDDSGCLRQWGAGLFEPSTQVSLPEDLFIL